MYPLQNAHAEKRTPDLVERPHPASAYREYLRCIRSRSLTRALDLMSVNYREQFESMSSDVDFGPLFELWCASQSMEIRIVACYIKQDWAVLDIRESRARFRVELRYLDGAWRVCAETPIKNEKRQPASLTSVV